MSHREKKRTSKEARRLVSAMASGPPIVVTEAWLREHTSEAGLTHKQARVLGLRYPVPEQALRALIGRQLSAMTAARLIAARDYVTHHMEREQRRAAEADRMTWIERAAIDASLRNFVDAEIARAGIELDTLRYQAARWKALAEHHDEKMAARRRHRAESAQPTSKQRKK